MSKALILFLTALAAASARADGPGSDPLDPGRLERVNVIAEHKRRSPSQGPIREDLRPTDVARAYEAAGAAALSVLTDEAFFGGRLSHLEEARAATALPVLRKDFIIDQYQLFEARCAGCHGERGDGDGVNKPYLDRSPADLTALSREHGGEFPYQEFYEAVAGTEAAGRDMPCFATVYEEAAREDHLDVPYEQEKYLETRLAALADYVARLQVR